MQTFFHNLIHKTSASIMHMAGWVHGGWHDCSQEEDSITPAPLPLTLSLPSRAYTNCWALGPPNFWSGSMTHLPHVSSTVTKQQSLAIMITSTRLLLKQPVCEIQADAGRKVFFSLIQVQPIFKEIHRPLSDTIVSALILILCGFLVSAWCLYDEIGQTLLFYGSDVYTLTWLPWNAWLSVLPKIKFYPACPDEQGLTVHKTGK